MAGRRKTASKGKRNSGKKSNTGSAKSGRTRKSPSTSQRRTAVDDGSDLGLVAKLISVVFICVLFISNFDVLGTFGAALKDAQFGIIGSLAYGLPVVLLVLFVLFSTDWLVEYMQQIIAIVAAYIDVAIMAHMVILDEQLSSGKGAFSYCVENSKGGGAIGGAIADVLSKGVGKVGAWIVIVIIMMMCITFIFNLNWVHILIRLKDLVVFLTNIIKDWIDDISDRDFDEEDEADNSGDSVVFEEERNSSKRRNNRISQNDKRHTENTNKTSVFTIVGDENAQPAAGNTVFEIPEENPAIQDINDGFDEETEWDDNQWDGQEWQDSEIDDTEKIAEYDAVQTEAETVARIGEVHTKTKVQPAKSAETVNLVNADEDIDDNDIIDDLYEEAETEIINERFADLYETITEAEEFDIYSIMQGNEEPAVTTGESAEYEVAATEIAASEIVASEIAPIYEETAEDIENEYLDNEVEYEETVHQVAEEKARSAHDEEVAADTQREAFDAVTPAPMEIKKTPSAAMQMKLDTEEQTELSDSERQHSEQVAKKAVAKKPEEKEKKKVKRLAPTNKNGLWHVPVYNKKINEIARLLNQPARTVTEYTEAELENTAILLKDTLESFGVKVEIDNYSKGPAITRFEIIPAKGVKVSRILNLADDIQLSLAARSIRIEAPIPGMSAVGIEIPNKAIELVSMYELLTTQDYQSPDFKDKLAFAVGKGLSGAYLVSNIGKMPHVLIAGATGSGKSVCINTLIVSLLFKYTPDEMKLLMIDPKVVELSVYNGIPHLLIPVITDTKYAASALAWCVNEMDDRYLKFEKQKVRDLAGYNRKIYEAVSFKDGTHPQNTEEYFRCLKENHIDEASVETLPMAKIVIIVDELADLMMTAGKEVEGSICRLAQLARACGIHLVIATQRPSVDVITGLIKANMPSRIAFSVSSGTDSRTILDMVGAEKLLGNGDMLFLAQGQTKPYRLQGAFVSDDEVMKVVDFWSAQINNGDYDDIMSENQSQVSSTSVSGGGSAGASAGANAGGGAGGGSDDEFMADAARFIIDKDKASIGMLQRKFKIGFNRAARIMDELCERGVVGEEEGTKPRRVLMSMEQLENALEAGEF